MGFERIWHKQYPAGVPTKLDYTDLTLPEFLTPQRPSASPARPPWTTWAKKSLMPLSTGW